MFRYTIQENVRVLHCSKSMRFGHSMRDCKSTTSVGGNCAEEHLTSQCKHCDANGRPKHKVMRCCAN